MGTTVIPNVVTDPLLITSRLSAAVAEKVVDQLRALAVSHEVPIMSNVEALPEPLLRVSESAVALKEWLAAVNEEITLMPMPVTALLSTVIPDVLLPPRLIVPENFVADTSALPESTSVFDEIVSTNDSPSIESVTVGVIVSPPIENASGTIILKAEMVDVAPVPENTRPSDDLSLTRISLSEVGVRAALPVIR